MLYYLRLGFDAVNRVWQRQVAATSRIMPGAKSSMSSEEKNECDGQWQSERDKKA
jgi:hypothetical protein